MVKNKELQGFAEKEHMMSIAIQDPKKIRGLEEQEEKLMAQIAELKESWGQLRGRIEEESRGCKETLKDKKVYILYIYIYRWNIHIKQSKLRK